MKMGFGTYLVLCFLATIWWAGPEIAVLAMFCGWWVIPVTIVVAYYIFKLCWKSF